jgi:tetratricopeptide (TPR) repeat protein
LRAGQISAARSANVEAIAHLRSGLACVVALPPDERRSRMELSLQLALGGPILATKGFASSETEAVCRRAEELSRELGDDTGLFTALRGLGYVFQVRANLREATKLVDEMVDLSHRIGDSTTLVEANHHVGALKFHLGAFADSRKWFERSNNYPGHLYSVAYGIDLGVFWRAYIGHCDWHLGFPDRALNIGKEAFTLAREAAHPFSTALALDYLAMLHQFRREPEAALEVAEEARDLCKEYRFGYYGAWSALVRAWAVAERCSPEEGLAAYRVALDEFNATGATLRMQHHLCLLAGIQRKAGRQAAGLALIAEAAQIAAKNDEDWCNAELERERGELLLLTPSDDHRSGAIAAFQRAMDIASDQGARMYELRARASLARLLGERGERKQARDLLSPIYESFTEGFDTADLSQVRSLLDELQK